MIINPGPALAVPNVTRPLAVPNVPNVRNVTLAVPNVTGPGRFLRHPGRS
jgi:hypothetical protein